MRARTDRPRRCVSPLGMAGAAVLALALSGCTMLPWDLRADDGGLEQARARHRALMEAQRATGTDSNTSRPQAAQSFEQTLRSADRYREAGDNNRALWTYLQAAQIEPSESVARERIAYLQLQPAPQHAESLFSGLLEDDPESVSAHLGLGLAHLAQGQLEPARASLERAVELDPEAPTAHSVLGAVYDRLGLHAEAKAELQAAHELAPRDPTILNNLGVSQMLSGELEAAEGSFRTAILLDGKDSAPRNNLGLVLGLSGRYEEALAAFRDAGSEQAALNNLGYVYFLTGQFEQAIASYEQALVADGSEQLMVLRNLTSARNALERRR